MGSPTSKKYSFLPNFLHLLQLQLATVNRKKYYFLWSVQNEAARLRWCSGAPASPACSWRKSFSDAPEHPQNCNARAALTTFSSSHGWLGPATRRVHLSVPGDVGRRIHVAAGCFAHLPSAGRRVRDGNGNGIAKPSRRRNPTTSQIRKRINTARFRPRSVHQRRRPPIGSKPCGFGSRDRSWFGGKALALLPALQEQLGVQSVFML
jgi:hypothetical protein